MTLASPVADPSSDGDSQRQARFFGWGGYGGWGRGWGGYGGYGGYGGWGGYGGYGGGWGGYGGWGKLHTYIRLLTKGTHNKN